MSNWFDLAAGVRGGVVLPRHLHADFVFSWLLLPLRINRSADVRGGVVLLLPLIADFVFSWLLLPLRIDSSVSLRDRLLSDRHGDVIRQ